ncbi:LOW QUALITY PROTEIN: hypothetical protein OSB04_019544 [Centaurea solstitialis]|uniref:CCHC-type domain-containing protein n=1 Tax=Centaurea solstitialis TaxID=347529 RepID=A0AA38T214_9ASTR|nr:LOW QUALITY PROTEIN: hypothetical protein OSB04_019544 [Centaurea solstitialis]
MHMVSFLEGIHPKIVEYLQNAPHVPTKLIPRVSATTTTAEILEHSNVKPIEDWSDLDREFIKVSVRCKRLLIMEIPNDIFESLDSCETSKELWGGIKTLNNRAICINEYHAFKALENESLQGTYSRFNSLISKCRRFGVNCIGEGNNCVFCSLNEEWLNLNMSRHSTLDLQVWSLSDIYGTLEKHEGKSKKEEKNKKKMMVAESDQVSFEDQVSMKNMMNTLALMTRKYKKRYKSFSERCKRESYDNRGLDDKRYKKGRAKEMIRELHRIWMRRVNDGCYKCGKLGHFAVECWSTRTRLQKPTRDVAYFKNKDDYYAHKSLMAKKNDLVTDESSKDEP